MRRFKVESSEVLRLSLSLLNAEAKKSLPPCLKAKVLFFIFSIEDEC